MIKLTALTLASLLLVACGSEPATPNAGNGTDNAKGSANMPKDDHGPATVNEEITVFERKVTVQQFEKVEAGGEIAVTVKFASSEERFKAVRCWIGIESGKGSMRSRLPRSGDADLHGHIEVPDPIPAESKLWFEFDHDGNKSTKSFAYH